MASNSPKVFQYMKLIGQLKHVERTGWVRKQIKDPESVADHMYRMAMMAFALPSNSELDRDKCVKIALVHDMSESIVGDITPWCGISKGEKRKREHEATSHISSFIPEDAGKELYQLWLEYENQSSPEAKFVKDLDKFEMLFQAYEYEKMYNKPQELQEFYDYTRDKYKFNTMLVKEWSKELEQQRNKFITDSVHSGGNSGTKKGSVATESQNMDGSAEGSRGKVASSSSSSESSSLSKKRKVETQSGSDLL